MQMALPVVGLVVGYLACILPRLRRGAALQEGAGYGSSITLRMPANTILLLLLRWRAAQMADQQRAQQMAAGCTVVIWCVCRPPHLRPRRLRPPPPARSPRPSL